ncbi:hypothetical protein TTHERM_00494480 (macronuclear) [Tetrahymena thermophila SB210]|uniref:Uncharacterized protein n=1 Tax=Tetrahymena thermophila (strain SB210) TaxID=312017 RepID=I7M9X3_TETTS|nr:hypothetical protein TTHERM_00494480 [Tetrahymena thermophila SB210]EAS02987.2 hypothetical protein TTHERM_00494480 [Tetrahymena thermophila SB210]|eukprot:XP_001023232.2 hypothetical protein TTHERM_00494480 [Tetrahymena thermophila SB210]
MDNKKPKQFLVNPKSFRDEDKPQQEGIQFHQQSPRFRNSKMQQQSQQNPQNTNQFKDETQMSPLQSPKGQKTQINSQNVLGSGGKFYNSKANKVEQEDFVLFEYKGEKDFFNKLLQKLNEAQSIGDLQVVRLFERVYKLVLEEDFSLSSLQKTIVRSNSNWKDLLKVKNSTSSQALIANILPHFSKALQRRSLSNIQDLLKITLLYQYDYYAGMEKQLNQIIDLFTKMLQIPQKSEEEDTISNHVQRLVLLNIQSFCIPQISSKFQTEFQLIFKRIQELIMHFFNLTNNQQSTSNSQSLPLSAAASSGSSVNDSSSRSNYYSFLRFLVTLLRTGHIVLAELKENKVFLSDANNQKLTEKVFLRIFKYVFLGNPTFHQVIFGQNQNRIFSNRLSTSSQLTDYTNGSRNNLSMNNSFSASSQSEWSENDEYLGNNDKTKIEVIEGKVRNQTCTLLSTIIRLFPAIVKNQWQTLIKSNNMTKDFIHSLKTHSSLEQKLNSQKQQNEQNIIPVEENKKDDHAKIINDCSSNNNNNNNNMRDYSLLYPNYMEASLLSCLIFEENNKIKSNALQTIQNLIENLPSKQLVSGLEIQKFEKSTSSFKPQSYLIYQSYKNIHFTLIHMLQTLCTKHIQQYDQNNNQILNQQADNLLQLSKDLKENPQAEDLFVNDSDEEVLSLCNQILKVYISLFNSTVQFEKMPFKEGIDLILRQFVLKVLRHVKTQDASLEALHLKYNALQILNCIAKCNIRFDLFANRYLQAISDESNQSMKQKNGSQINLFDLCIEDILIKNSQSELNSELSQCMHDISLLQKEDALREMISLESISLLTNLQINYFDCTLLYVQQQSQTQQSSFPLWEKISEKIKTFEEHRNKLATDKKRLFLLYDLVIMIAEKNNCAVQIAKQVINKQISSLKALDQTQLENNQDDAQENIQEEDENQENKSQIDKNLTQSFEQNVDLVKKSEEFDKIFSFYLINKVKQLMQQSIEQEQGKIKDDGELPLMVNSLNMSVHIKNELWLQNQDFYTFFKNQIYNLNITSSIRFYVLKALGSLISRTIFNQDQSNCKQILDILLREKQLIGQKKTQANLSVYAKLSQSLASWCYYVKDFSILSQQSLQNLFVALQDISSSPKDKVSPHGLRALGIFLMKMNKNLYLSICEPSKEDQVLCKLITENLSHKSSKVVWNACVAIQNIFSNINCILTETNKINKLHFFFSSKSISSLIQSLEVVLQSINNQKSQFYALKALKNVINHPISLPLQNNNLLQQQDIKILNERIPHLLNVLTEIGSNMYSFHQTHNTNKSLGELVVQFLIQMITQVHSLLFSNEILVEFIKDKYYQIISSFSLYIYQLWKNNKLDLHLAVLKEESYQDSEQQIFNYKSKSLQNTQSNTAKTKVEDTKLQNIQDQPNESNYQDNFEELLIKGQDEFKSVQFDFNQIKKVKFLKEELNQLKEASTILLKVIDQNDDLSVSLTIYDHIKEYASVNLEEDIIKYSIH